MAHIVVAGGGICGTAAALMLARDGHQVTVLDRDEAPVPDDVESAWDWPRRAVAQFRFAHVMLPGGRQVLSTELPDVVERLRDNGALELDMLALPPGAPPAEGDDRFTTVTGRRTTIEWALASTLDAEAGVEVRRGTAVAGLRGGSPALDGVPHVTGVRLATGEEIAADLVVDATGRRSPTVDWLTELGGRPPEEEAEDIGFTYTGRFFRSPDGSLPGPVGLTPCGSISLLTIPSDNGTWSATLYTASNDKALRQARELDVWERLWRAFPAHSHWIDGEPISELTSMSGVVDRTRHYVVDGAPVVTGMLSIADAHACTNPSIGRGMTIGLLHTVAMRDAVRSHLDDPVQLALAFDALTTERVTPFHVATRDLDRSRMAEVQATIEGRQPESDPAAAVGLALFAAALTDGDAARWLGELLGCLTQPTELFARPGVFERVIEIGASLPPPEPYGPDRQALLELIAS